MDYATAQAAQDLIDMFANRFRLEVLRDFGEQKVPLDLQEELMPVIEKCIERFSWAAAMVVAENELRGPSY